MKRGRVCHLSSVHTALDTRIFHKEVKTLARAGYEVVLIAQHGRNESVGEIKIVSLSKPRNRFRRVLGTCRVFNLAYKEKADVYHFHDPELIPIAILLKLARRAKIIYDIHEDVPKSILAKEYIHIYLRSFASRVFALIERSVFPLFDGVITAGEDITLHLPRSPKVVVVRNFTSLEIVREAERERGDSRRPAVLIYIGGISEGRCVNEMIVAAKSLEKKAKLILLGRFSDARLEDKVRAKAGSNVEIIGQVPYEKVPSFLSEADIGLVCYRPDPNNLAASWRNTKLFEYMAAGLPVIASNFPAWKEIVEGNNCGLTVDPMNPEEIARAVEYFIEHPDETRRMGENSRKAMLGKYNWEAESEKLLALYKDLLK